MATLTPTVNYSNRQVDVELLQSIVQPVGTYHVVISNVAKTPKIVAGIQKALQRYTALLLTMVGNNTYAPAQGTDLIGTVLQGLIQDQGQFNHIFGLANSEALRQMSADDVNTDVFGETSPDEVIQSVELLSTDVDTATNTLRAEIQFTMESGDTLDYIIPVAVPR